MTVVVTDPLAETGLRQLREAGYNVRTAYDAQQDDLLDLVGDASALIVRSGTEVSEDVFDAAEDLVVVGRAGTGVDNIDLASAREHGVVVVNAPEPNARAAAEYTIGMLLATTRSIPQAHATLRDGQWEKGTYVGTELSGKVLGIVGFGRVGRRVARISDALGMDVMAYDPYVDPDCVESSCADLAETLEVCLEQADVLTLHVPLTPETNGLVGHDELRLLEGGYLINCARGGIVDENALAKAVRDGVLEGAAVDVFDQEPVSATNLLVETDDVVVTPHLGAQTRSAREDVASLIVSRVTAALEGEPVENALNTG